MFLDLEIDVNEKHYQHTIFKLEIKSYYFLYVMQMWELIDCEKEIKRCPKHLHACE